MASYLCKDTQEDKDRNTKWDFAAWKSSLFCSSIFTAKRKKERGEGLDSKISCLFVFFLEKVILFVTRYAFVSLFFFVNKSPRCRAWAN